MESREAPRQLRGRESDTVLPMSTDTRNGGLPVNAMRFGNEVLVDDPAKAWRYSLMVTAAWSRLVQQPLNPKSAE